MSPVATSPTIGKKWTLKIVEKNALYFEWGQLGWKSTMSGKFIEFFSALQWARNFSNYFSFLFPLTCLYQQKHALIDSTHTDRSLESSTTFIGALFLGPQHHLVHETLSICFCHNPKIIYASISVSHTSLITFDSNLSQHKSFFSKLDEILPPIASGEQEVCAFVVHYEFFMNKQQRRR